MKRRTNNNKNEEWVDLVQASSEVTGRDDNQKTRTEKRNRFSAKVLLGVTLVIFIWLDSKIHSWRQEHFDSFSANKRRNRKVVLLGPHDRYNDFGDILAQRVVTKLLVDRAGFIFNSTDEDTNTLLLGGIVTRDDMDHHGLTPHKTIHSMKTIQAMSRQDLKYGPYDIVFTGGSGEGPGDEGPSVLYEKHKEAVAFLETEALRNSASADRVYDCPYLFPKELLLPIVEKHHGIFRKHKTGSVSTLPRSKKNYAIVDSLETPLGNKPGNLRGGNEFVQEAVLPPLVCRRVANHADHLGYRSRKPFAPDSLVMTQQVLGDEIETIFDTEVAAELLNFPEFASSNKNDLRYIAVQHETAKHVSKSGYTQELADALDKVSKKLGNIPVVFFAAGRVGRSLGDHVAFALSREVAQTMQQPSVVYETEHALKVAGLISEAQAVVSTNLHVRILSFVYQKPRATWHGGVNQQAFVETWESDDVALLGMLSSVGDTWEMGLQRFFEDQTNLPHITQNQTEVAIEKVTQSYLKNFETWSNLLVTRTGRGEDDDAVY